MAKTIDKETQRLLLEVVDHFDKEDYSVRERQIRVWKQLKYYWDGFQRLWWSDVAHDWRVYEYESDSESYGESSYYDKPINVYRAYLESIIAALSVNVPVVQCFPDDADNAHDLLTAKAGDYISKLIYKHNDAPLLWIHALFVYCTEGLVFAYNYTDENEKYGTYDEDNYQDVEEKTQVPICPICQTGLVKPELLDEVEDEFQPTDVVAQNLVNDGIDFCPECLAKVNPQFREQPIIVTKLIGRTTKPKSRQCIEVMGGSFVKVPNWARTQAECPYLIYAYETHYANVLNMFKDLRGYLKPSEQKDLLESVREGGMYDPYEQWGRLSTQYYGEYPVNNVTIRHAWLRPCAFEILKEESERESLKTKYPNGVKVTLANKHFAEACPESLDDHWTLSRNPLSDYIHYQPLGVLLTSVQEITNEIVSLTLQTIEHGIPQTFADPNVLNFDEYSQTETKPGVVYPARPAAGKSMGDAFHEVSTANLSQEVLPFNQYIQSAGQLVSGALPSLFGGDAPNSSKTASQYAMSRAQALQRLQTTWKMLTFWWKDVFGKVIPQYIKTVVDDERYVEKGFNGDFVNILIRKSELEGKIGSVELQSSEELPITWQQKRDIVMQLMQTTNPTILQALLSPENLPLLSEAIGLSDFVLPGANDRQKQFDEIKQLIDSEPIMGEMGEESSVPVDPILDNHLIQSEICRQYLLSEAGRLLKIQKPLSYKNILLHLQQHVVALQMMQMQQASVPQPEQQNSESTEPAVAQGPPNGQDESAIIQ